MFKKPAVLIVLALYLATATGFALNIHYCFNRITSVQIDAPTKSCDKEPGMTKKRDCCKDIVVKVKVDDKHQAEVHSVLSQVFAPYVINVPFGDFITPVQDATACNLPDRGPPLIDDGIPAIIKNCVFRI